MKRSFDIGFALATVLSFAVVITIVTLANLLVLGLLAQIPFLQIEILSSWAFWLFAFGMVFASVITSPIRYILSFVLAIILPERLLDKVILRLDQIVGFFLILCYQYLLDEVIQEISLSFYSHLILTFIYMMAFDLMVYIADMNRGKYQHYDE